MKFQRQLRQLKKSLPGEIFLEPATLGKYAGDKWFAAHEPDAVALPRSTESVAKILAFAHKHKIPVTPRGAGHGYVGGCVPMHGGIALSIDGLSEPDSWRASSVMSCGVRMPATTSSPCALIRYSP